MIKPLTKAQRAATMERKLNRTINLIYEDFGKKVDKILRNSLIPDRDKTQQIATELTKAEGLIADAKEIYYNELYEIWKDEIGPLFEEEVEQIWVDPEKGE